MRADEIRGGRDRSSIGISLIAAASLALGLLAPLVAGLMLVAVLILTVVLTPGDRRRMLLVGAVASLVGIALHLLLMTPVRVEGGLV